MASDVEEIDIVNSSKIEIEIVNDDPPQEEPTATLKPVDVQTPSSPDNKKILEASMTTPTPPTQLKNASFQPHRTRDGRNSPSPAKDYEILYREVKRRLFEQAQNSVSRYQDIESKHSEEMKKQKHEYSKREATLITDNDLLNEAISVKDKQIAHLNENIKEHSKVLAEKDKIINELKQQLAGNVSCQTHPELRRVKSDEEMFRLKPKRTTKSAKHIELKCEFKDCNEKDVDLVKCCMCSTWVCESCNDVPVAKLKPIMNKCRSVLFTCKKCHGDIGTENQPNIATMGAENANLLTSLQNIFDKKISQLETKIEKSIDKKLGDKLDTVNSLAEKISAREEESSEEKKSYAGILNVPKEVRKIMQETRNDEKVDLVEQEKRCQNFIIHGAEEVGKDEEEIKVNDEAYLVDILKHIDVNSKPDKVIRLGKVNDTKARVMKIVMPTKALKDEVMNNLRKLKGTGEKFGKISVTDDYTVTERQKIKDFTEKAREQSKEDNTRVFKVRGDPKNGLRIISIKKN